ncbi:MAG: VOC family protein [Pseudomonadota bacterium]
MGTKFYHVMVRVLDLEKSMAFYEMLGFTEDRRTVSDKGRFTNVHLTAEGDARDTLELTYNWDGDDGLPSDSRHFGHIAVLVDDIYAKCQEFMDAGVTINRPPHDGNMAFIRSPDNISIELLQNGDPMPPAEPWASMEKTGHW